MLQMYFSSVQSLSCVQLFVTSWTAARQASLSITNSRRFFFPSIRVFSNESALHMRWPKYWSFSFSIIPSKEIPGLISFGMDWLDLLGREETPWEFPRDCQESSPTPHFKSVNFSALSILHSPTLTSVHDHWKKP